MKRDMISTAHSVDGKIPELFDITALEMGLLSRIAQSPDDGGIWEALEIAFKYGFVLGQRSEKKAQKLRKRAL